MTDMRLREFAEHLGKKPSYVTELKKNGRLVFAEGGRVNVEATLERIQATADPSKIGVVERHARERAEKQAAPDESAIPPELNGADKSGSVYQKARAMREQYNAMLAKIDYEKSIGHLLVTTEAVGAVADGDAIIRTRLESLPNILSPRLAAESDENKIRAILIDEIEHLLNELSKTFKKMTHDTNRTA